MRSALLVVALAGLAACGAGSRAPADSATPPADILATEDGSNLPDDASAADGPSADAPDDAVDAVPDVPADAAGHDEVDAAEVASDLPPVDDDANPDVPSDPAGDVQAQDTAAPPDPAGDVPASDDGATDVPSDVPAWTAPFGVLSLNLHCLKLDGTSFATNAERFAAIAAEVAARDVAVIAIQESCRTATTDALALLEDALEAATGTAWSTTWSEAHVGWEGTPDEAIEGVAVAVRGALTDPGTLVFSAQGSLRRVAATAVLPPQYGSLRVVSVHLDFETPAIRTAQAREAASWVVTTADPSSALLVAGDFNDREGQPPHQALVDYDFRDLSDPLDPGRIDHVFAHRGAPLEVVDVLPAFDGTNGPIVSDHTGVLVRVMPAAGEAVVRTRVLAHVDVGWGNSVSVRGSRPPLSWTAGWPAVSQGGNLWKLVWTGIPAGEAFSLKCLKNDTLYQQGADVAGTGGATIDVSPVF